MVCCVAYSELMLVVDDVVSRFCSNVHLMLFPQRADEECLHYLLLSERKRIYDILEVGVVSMTLAGFLGNSSPTGYKMLTSLASAKYLI